MRRLESEITPVLFQNVSTQGEAASSRIDEKG
jgi:hypothetical protein